MTTEPFRYNCHTCGEEHEGMPAFGFDYPSEYMAVPEADRERRADISSDTCVIDLEAFFVRGRIEIPVHDHQEPFEWGVWVSVSKTSFALFLDTWEQQDRDKEQPFFGWLTAVPPLYPPALLKSMVHLLPYPTRPLIELEPTDHPLAVEQREGISIARAQEMAELLLHRH